MKSQHKNNSKTRKEQQPKSTIPKERSQVALHRQLRTKIIASFLVPVLCIIFLGALPINRHPLQLLQAMRILPARP